MGLDSVMVNNYFLSVIFADFNAKTNLWYNSNITAPEDSKTGGVTSQFGLEQFQRNYAHYW